MLRYLWNVVVLTAATVFAATLALVVMPVGLVHRPSLRVMTHLARMWSKMVVAGCGVKVEAEGFEHLEPGRAYVVLSNHTSYFDVLAIYARVPRDLVPVAKRELGFIPIFGWALKAGAAIMIDRRDPERARASISRAGDTIRAGRSVLMFPEGTRSRSRELKPFKKGPFHLAQGAGVPILPVAVSGAADVLPVGDWRIRPGTIRVRMGAPISPSEVGEGSPGRAALSDRVRGEIEGLLTDGDRP